MQPRFPAGLVEATGHARAGHRAGANHAHLLGRRPGSGKTRGAALDGVKCRRPYIAPLALPIGSCRARPISLAKHGHLPGSSSSNPVSRVSVAQSPTASSKPSCIPSNVIMSASHRSRWAHRVDSACGMDRGLQQSSPFGTQNAFVASIALWVQQPLKSAPRTGARSESAPCAVHRRTSRGEPCGRIADASEECAVRPRRARRVNGPAKRRACDRVVCERAGSLSEPSFSESSALKW
jgi:hypothetical protein